MVHNKNITFFLVLVLVLVFLLITIYFLKKIDFEKLELHFEVKTT
jgi:hypothetical protein